MTVAALFVGYHDSDVIRLDLSVGGRKNLLREVLCYTVCVDQSDVELLPEEVSDLSFYLRRTSLHIYTRFYNIENFLCIRIHIHIVIVVCSKSKIDGGWWAVAVFDY